MLATSLALAAMLGGCEPRADNDQTSGTTEDELASANGLKIVNGLTMLNGLSGNGLSGNGLSGNGLSGNGLLMNPLNTGVLTSGSMMNTSDGRSTMSYLVRCALASGKTLTKKDQYGTSYTFAGALGVAPEWETTACGITCQERLSACVLAHVNTSGTHISIWLDGEGAIGYGQNTNFPYQEGSFFGNIFTNPPKAYFCNGKDFDQGAVPGRLGAGQSGAPYTNPFGSGAYCKDRCTAADYPSNNDGYKSCNGFNHVVTVWRNFDPNTDYKVCARHSGKCLDVMGASTANYAQLIQYYQNYQNNQKWRITQVSPGKYNFKNVNSGKLLDINGGWTGDGAQLIQYQATGSANQQWSFTPTGDGFYKFSPGTQPAGSLDVKEYSTADGAIVQQWTWNNQYNQQWSITPY
ncbi:MAG TPA: RICIN domain-containing protein [Polyangia bacterium]|nr:RICIN domain-containing protein [Polyangia bacterium]